MENQILSHDPALEAAANKKEELQRALAKLGSLYNGARQYVYLNREVAPVNAIGRLFRHKAIEDVYVDSREVIPSPDVSNLQCLGAFNTRWLCKQASKGIPPNRRHPFTNSESNY